MFLFSNDCYKFKRRENGKVSQTTQHAAGVLSARNTVWKLYARNSISSHRDATSIPSIAIGWPMDTKDMKRRERWRGREGGRGRERERERERGRE